MGSRERNDRSPRVALYTGSFDPPTNGHVEVIRAAVSVCDRLVVGVGTHPTKAPILSLEARAALIREVVAPIAAASGCAIEVATFSGLAVDAANTAGAGLLIRGVRSASDLDDEMNMAGMNATMAPDIRTVFIPASPATRHVTATLVRQIAALGGDVSAFVPERVAAALSKTFRRQA